MIGEGVFQAEGMADAKALGRGVPYVPQSAAGAEQGQEGGASPPREPRGTGGSGQRLGRRVSGFLWPLRPPGGASEGRSREVGASGMRQGGGLDRGGDREIPCSLGTFLRRRAQGLPGVGRGPRGERPASPGPGRLGGRGGSRRMEGPRAAGRRPGARCSQRPSRPTTGPAWGCGLLCLSGFTAMSAF